MKGRQAGAADKSADSVGQRAVQLAVASTNTHQTRNTSSYHPLADHTPPPTPTHIVPILHSCTGLSLLLLWYGLYFGILGRDLAEVATEQMVRGDWID